MKSKNERAIGGNVHVRRFAYINKNDYSRFGLLYAENYKDARKHLGSGFYIRKTWLTLEEERAQAIDRDRRWEIVSSIFLNPLSRGFVG